MSHYSEQANDSETLKRSEILETPGNSKNDKNIKINGDKSTTETNGRDETDYRDVERSSINSKSIHLKFDTAAKGNISSLQISDNPKLISESNMSLNSNTSLKSQLSAASEMSRISLKSFQIYTKTPPNSKATCSWDMYDSIPVPAPPRLILCVGVCTLDIVHICEEFPSEKTKQLLTEGYWQRGGNASNTCTVLKNLGAECEFLGMMSKLPAFSFLADDCRDRGIIIENCPLVDMYPPFSSILACRPSGTLTVIHTNLGFPILKCQHFKEKVQLKKYSWIHFEARNPEETKPMINIIRRFDADRNSQGANPIMISLELAKNDKDLLSLAIRANILFIGREFALHFGWSTPKDTVYNLRQLVSVMQLREEKDPDEMDICFRCPHIICPWGSEGCSILTSSYEYNHIAALEIDQLVDAKGSGDTFVATIIYAMNNLDMELTDAVTLGCEVAVFKMQHWGLDCIKDYTIVDKSKGVD